MGPAVKQSSFRHLLVRLLIVGLLIAAVRFMYGAIVLGEKCEALDFCFFSQPQTDPSSMLGDNPIWSTKEWRRMVSYYTGIFQDLLKDEFLSKNSKSLCMDAAAGQEVLALKEIGVVDAVGVSKKKSLPLVVSGNLFSLPFGNNTFDFIFCGHYTIERSIRPADLAREIRRTLKSDGFLVVQTSSAGDLYSLNSFLDLFPGFVLQRNRETRGLDNSPAREIVLQKSDEEEAEKAAPYGECIIPDYKLNLLQSVEPLIEEEPLKPWITLKKNAQNIKYLSSMVDISFKTRYVYVDVGSRSYGSSIVSWFKKQYPKQNKTFGIYAIEADRTFYKEYELKKGVSLVPFAAWIRNETLSFEVNGGKGGRGMGRIVPASSSAVDSDQSRVLDEIQGLDFAEWLKSTVSMNDYVVMKMDIEGAEFDVLPRLIDTGAICLIDELFLECHYNRWQKCCPGKRSAKYKNTYGQCLDLFSKLRNSGVLVHQWW